MEGFLFMSHKNSSYIYTYETNGPVRRERQ